MDTKKETTTIVVNEREKMREVYNIIEAQIKKLEAPINGGMKTNGRFYFVEGKEVNKSSEIDINKTTSIKKLREIAGFLYLRKEFYDKGANILGETSFELFKWLGSTYDDWINDLKLRKHTLTVDSELRKLKSQRDKLSIHFTAEDKLSKDLNDVVKMLGLDM